MKTTKQERDTVRRYIASDQSGMAAITRAILDDLATAEARNATLEADIRDNWSPRVEQLTAEVERLRGAVTDLVKALDPYTGNDECEQYETDDPVDDCSCRWCDAERAIDFATAPSPGKGGGR